MKLLLNSFLIINIFRVRLGASFGGESQVVLIERKKRFAVSWMAMEFKGGRTRLIRCSTTFTIANIAINHFGIHK